MKLTYIPSKDELLIKIFPTEGRVNKKLEPLKIWLDKNGSICAISIAKWVKEFRKSLSTVKLGGIWKGIKITEKDIKATREKLLRKIEGKR